MEIASVRTVLVLAYTAECSIIAQNGPSSVRLLYVSALNMWRDGARHRGFTVPPLPIRLSSFPPPFQSAFSVFGGYRNLELNNALI